MQQRILSIKNLAYFLISFVIIGFLMREGQFIIVPLLFAFLLSTLVLPIHHFYDRFIKIQLISTLLTFFTVLLPLTGLFTFFSIQIVSIIGNLDSITGKVVVGTQTIFEWLYVNFEMTEADTQALFKENLSKFITSPLSVFQSSINSFAGILLNIGLVFLYMFFILAYRGAIKNFILMQFNSEQRLNSNNTLRDIQKMLRQYLSGLLTVMVILTIMNGIGLSIIGIEYPWLWASIAAVLTIIPYIGTTLGGSLPFFYALATASSWHQPVAVVVMYAVVQQIEGNLITPYVVGSKVRINPLVAILAILLMNYFWGVVGIILAIPTAAIVKIIFDQIPQLKPIGSLMSSDILKEKDKFLTEWDADKYRLFSLFSQKKEKKEDGKLHQ